MGDKSTMKRQAIQTPAAPAAVGAYSPAVHVTGVSEMVFVSGQIGLDPSTNRLVEGGVEAEAACALKNLAAVLSAAGLGLEQVVRATVYLARMDDFARVDAIYARHFPGDPPARVAVQVAGLPKGAAVEIDAIAVR